MKDILLDNDLTSGDIRLVETYFTYLEPERNIKPTVYWYHVLTGTGKSKKVRNVVIYIGKMILNGGMFR
jgi:hypothetical protein